MRLLPTFKTIIYTEIMTESESDYDYDALTLLLKAQLDDKKALDIVLLDLRERTAFADFFIIATGTSRTHVASLSEEVDRFFHERGISVLNIAGLPEATWVVVDAGDVVVHLFQREIRAFYDLEKLWSTKSRPAMISQIPETLVS